MYKDFPALEHCHVCPLHCGVNRYERAGACGADSELKIDLAHLHHGEEPVISGTRGSGTIFFSHCNLHCVFCQNHSISQLGWGTPQTIEKCAQMNLKPTRLRVGVFGAEHQHVMLFLLGPVARISSSADQPVPS